MLRRASDIHDSLKVAAADGAVGRLAQFYFDDLQWIIRYLVLDISTWSAGPNLLLPPAVVKSIDWPARILNLDLTKDQVANCPDINQHKPVSRQHEGETFSHLGWPFERAFKNNRKSESGDPYLRSSKEIIGYHLNAIDGELGHLQDLIIDDERWRVVRLVADTRHWWHGKSVLIAPDQITRINWVDSIIDVPLTKKQIKDSPEFDAAMLTIEAPPLKQAAELF